MNKRIFIIILLSSFIVIKAGDLTNTNGKKIVESKQDSSVESPIKIRVVEGKRIVAETVEGKDIEARLMQVRNKLDKEIKALGQEIEKDIADLQGKARLKIDQEFIEKEQVRISRKKKELDVKAEAAQEEFTRAFNRELAKFNSKIKETVTEAAEAKGWDMVKIKETGEIMYTSKRIDATDEVIRKHDTRYKAHKAEEAKAKQAVSTGPKIGA